MTDKQKNYWLAHDFFQQAVCCYEQKDYKNALINYTKVIELAPDFEYEMEPTRNMYNERGVCYYQLENYEQALADFSQAIESALGNTNIADVFYFNRGVCYYKQKNYKDAINDFSKSIEFRPHDCIEGYFNRACCYYEQKNYESAIDDFSEVIKLNSDEFKRWRINYPDETVNNSDTYCYRGICYYQQGNYERALEDFSKATELNPDSINAYYHRGLCFAQLKDYESAFLGYRRIIEENHEYDKNIRNINVYIELPWSLSFIESSLNETESALLTLNKAIELDSNNAEAYCNRADFYYKNNKYSFAIADYTKAVELDSNYGFAYYKRAHCYRKQKNYNLALIDCSKVIELKPESSGTYYLQGCCYYEQENYEFALDNYTQAINLKPDFYLFYRDRAYCYQKQKNYKDAINDFSKAIELMLKIPEDNRNKDYAPCLDRAYKHRADCYYEQGSYELAANDYTESLKISGDVSAYDDRGQCYFNLGYYEKALADFTEILNSFPDAIYFNSSYGYYNKSLCYYNLWDYDSSLKDIDNAIKYSKSLETKKNYCHTAKIIACDAKKYDKAENYIEQMFENVDSKEQQHKQIYLDDIKKEKTLEETNKRLKLEVQEKEAAQKQVEEKNKELNNLIAMFAHNFLGTLQCIRSNAEHDNNPKIHLKTVKMMSGALTAFSIISADDEKLIEQLKQDNTGEINLQQNLANNLALAISQLLSKTNKDKIINIYLNYLQKTAQIKPETNAEDLRFNDDDWEKWQALQQQWENEFNTLFSETVDLSLLQMWIETNFFPIQIIGFNDYNICFKEFGITDSVFLVIFMEILVNALKYTDASQNQPLTLTLCKQDQYYKLTCENPSANETNRGSHKGTDFLKSIAHKVNGQFITESTERSFKSTFIIPAELLE